MSWLLIGALFIIWAAFLLPFGARRASPASTVEEFERKMDLLAETNGSPSGRWVLVPRKGERFVGSRDRQRIRVRRRRRTVFTFLFEATIVTLLIGLFPPLRPMLVGTMVLGGLLLVYVALLLHLRAQDIRTDRAVRAERLQLARYERIRIDALQHAAYVARYGSVNGNGNGNGLAVPNGNGNGYHPPVQAEPTEDEGDALFGAGVRIIEDDVHVIVRRTSDLDGEHPDRIAR